MKATLVQLFQETFGEPPRFLVRSPGRVNLIGEHTDYNDGFVLPLAIDYAVWIALSPSRDSTVTIHAHDFDETAAFDLSRFSPGPSGWIEYIKGVAFALQSEGTGTEGWRGCILSNLPMGAGLSSSAALETGAVMAFSAVSGFDFKPKAAALLGQQAENQWVGLNCGIMDQLAAAGGVENHALFIDCRSLETSRILLPPEVMVAILDTTTRRKLVASEYNSRRKQCETAAREFHVPALRDLSLEALLGGRDRLDFLTFNRARHVISENQRVLATLEHLRNGDMNAVGKRLLESHESLRDLYEVSSTALDQIVEAAMESSGCMGARMTGAGFGGCAVALVHKDSADTFTGDLIRRYHMKSGKTAAVYLTSAAAGTELIHLQ